MKLPVLLELQTLAIRFATVDNAEAFKAAFLEARQYVLENQVGLRIDVIFFTFDVHPGETDQRRRERRS